jgi:hypothetical protein
MSGAQAYLIVAPASIAVFWCPDECTRDMDGRLYMRANNSGIRGWLP